ncbi:MAG: DUF1015 domain-containing protein [Coriobacteriia bacterium]|nr:DUF1015 domain-containing protein [Coriobacteriia bacterium]
MSLVRPFTARFYRHRPGEDLTARVAPPYDVISPGQRAALLERDPHNVVALELPEGPLDRTAPDNRYATGRATWAEWHDHGVIVDDESPAIYVLEQSWEHEGRHVRRRAFVAAVRLHPFEDRVILPHERTLPKALADRFELLRATAANLSQVFGLFSDPAGETDRAFEAAMATASMFHAVDDDGVESRVWAIRDAATIAAVSEVIGERPIFIADGHHRYTTALAYRDERREIDRTVDRRPADPAYDYVMMALVNMDGPDLTVLPTHRLVRAAGAFDAASFWNALAEHFNLAEPTTGHLERLGTETARTTFTVRTADGTTRVATLRPDADPTRLIAGEHSDDWKRLDVAILQELILKPLFGVSADEPASLERLTFVKDARAALEVVDADVAFVLAPTRVEQLRAVALAGETMPQKSTYFYPKLLSGLLFRPVD